MAFRSWCWIAAAAAALLACETTLTVVTEGDGGAGAGASGAGGSSTVMTTSSAAGGEGVGASTGTGGDPYDKSECDSAADCPGGACVEVNLGYRICQYLPVEATACPGSGLDECCDSSACANGEKCFAAPLVPFCGGVQVEPHNECGADRCTTDDDCDEGVCMPAGTVGNAVAMCVSAACGGLLCGQESLSSCALVREPCCNGPLGFMCIDQSTGCQNNAECDEGYCDAGVCVDGGPICPA